MKIVLKSGSFDALIFDSDGTLVDSAMPYFRAFETVLRQQGLVINEDWYRARTGLTPQALLQVYGKEVHPLPLSIEELLPRVTSSFQANLHTMNEIPAVADLARQWYGKVPMAVASNGQKPNVQASLEAVGLLRLFNVIVTIEDVQHGKPAPDVFLEASRQLGARPDRSLVLEDSNEGLAAAKAAGMRAIDVRPYR